METTSRVELVATEKPNGMTAYSLIYTPPVRIARGKVISREDPNIESYTCPCSDVEKLFNSRVMEMDVIRYMQDNEPYRDKKCHAAIRSFKLFCNGSCKFEGTHLCHEAA